MELTGSHPYEGETGWGFFTCQWFFSFAIKIASVQFMHENYCAAFVFLTKIV